MSTATEQANPFQRRHQLLADMRAARVAEGILRGEMAQLEAATKAADAEVFQAEMDLVVGSEGAAERRDAALERVQALRTETVAKNRGAEAAGQVIKIREGQLAVLHDEPEAFDAFCAEAEAATTGAVHEMTELLAQVHRAARAWDKAAALWRPLNGPLRRRLEALNDQQGRHQDPVREGVVGAFPISLPNGLASAAPRPPGIERLRARR